MKRRTGPDHRFSLPIIEALNNNNIIFDISGRFKSIYSIWKKMQSRMFRLRRFRPSGCKD
jgi:(p)ppGpp synthase/HD superfamily hydrolase